jgi:hypothetical protein
MFQFLSNHKLFRYIFEESPVCIELLLKIMEFAGIQGCIYVFDLYICRRAEELSANAVFSLFSVQQGRLQVPLCLGALSEPRGQKVTAAKQRPC